MDKNCKEKSMTVREAMERVLGFSILGKGYPLTIAEETSIALAAEVRRLRDVPQDARELADAIEAVAVSFDDTILDSLGDRLLKVGEYYWDSKKAANIITAYRARILDEAADRGLRYYENTDIAHRSGEGLYRAISGHDRAAVRWEVEK